MKSEMRDIDLQSQLEGKFCHISEIDIQVRPGGGREWENFLLEMSKKNHISNALHVLEVHETQEPYMVLT